MEKLLHELLEDGILGSVQACCWSMEFQKRGLPHGHLLLTMHPQDKTKNATHVDARVCAEFPPGDPARIEF